MLNTVINVNGHLQSLDGPPGPPVITAFDRAYLYGDSLYEVVRSHRGALLHVEEHLIRLEESARLCSMDLTVSRAEFRSQIEKSYAHFRNQPGMRDRDAYVRLIVSRGEGKIGFGKSAVLSPTRYSLIVQPLSEPTEDDVRKGLHLGIAERHRNSPFALTPAMKSGNYLNSLLAFIEVTPDGYDDALLCNADGHVTEGTTFNVGYFRRGILCTPPFDIGILDGITRREALTLARELDIEVRETRFPRERLYEADEVWVTSTIKGVFPVTRVDGRRIADGKPGPLTLRLRAAYQKRIDHLAQSHSSLAR